MACLDKNRQYFEKGEWIKEEVGREIDEGLSLLARVDRNIVTFFGSHRVSGSSPHYMHCKRTAYELGKRGYAVFSGGGSGIMRAANEGAKEAGAPSVGVMAKLMKCEEVPNDIFDEFLSCHFVFVRRFILSIKSGALVFYPGGLGTLNELFEYATLMQTGIVDRVPIICVSREYWEGLFGWMDAHAAKEGFFISEEDDRSLFHFADTLDEILAVIKRK